MLPDEREKFIEVVTRALAAYGKHPTGEEFEAWWYECRGLSLEAVQAAFTAHRDDPERGERAPRPVDITRRMKAGQRDAGRCAARDANAQCAYPGLFSDGTGGDGPWWCPLHRVERAGPEASKRIAYSLETPWEDFRARQMAKRAGDGARSPAVVERAWDIAKRHGNRQWQIGAPFSLPGQQREAAD